MLCWMTDTPVALHRRRFDWNISPSRVKGQQVVQETWKSWVLSCSGKFYGWGPLTCQNRVLWLDREREMCLAFEKIDNTQHSQQKGFERSSGITWREHLLLGAWQKALSLALELIPQHRVLRTPSYIALFLHESARSSSIPILWAIMDMPLSPLASEALRFLGSENNFLSWVPIEVKEADSCVNFDRNIEVFQDSRSSTIYCPRRLQDR